nr:SRPBCC family protein [Caldimonas brevitalea]
MLLALERHLGERELYAEVVAPGTLRLTRWLPGPLERVWAYLTEPDKRALWLAGGPLQLQRGGRVELQFRHADLSSVLEPTPARYAHLEGGARLLGEVTVCDPPHRLAYTWTGDAGEPSEVRFELTSHGERVLLVLTHMRLSGRAAMVSVAGGWHTHLDLLADRLQGRPPAPFWSSHAVLEAWYEQHLPEC